MIRIWLSSLNILLCLLILRSMGLDDQSLKEYVNAELELWKRKQSTERAVQRQDEVER